MSIFSSLSASSAAAAHGSTFVSNRKVNSLRFQNSLAQVQVTKLPSEFKAKYSLEINARKSKTLKAASKRYKVTATGKVLHRRPGKAHLNGPKSTSRKKRLSLQREVGLQQMPLVRTLLPYSRAAVKRV
ncbi:unnamed protein product [Bathycoccus prasinos]